MLRREEKVHAYAATRSKSELDFYVLLTFSFLYSHYWNISLSLLRDRKKVEKAK